MKENNSKKRDFIILTAIAAAALLVLVLFLVLVQRNQTGDTELTIGSIFKTIGISMIPVIELRGAIPVAVGEYHMSFAMAFLFSYIGNCLIIAPVVLLTRTVFEWLKRHVGFLRRGVEFFEAKIRSKGEKALKYAEIGLLLFVAVPLPGTGAWTGAMIAGLMDIRLRSAIPIISVGVLIAGIIVMLVTNAAVLIF